jgi:hypothetical protein
MRHHVALSMLYTTAVALILMQGAPTASAYQLLNCKWASSNVVWSNLATTGYKTTMTNAMAAWSSAGTDVSLTAVPPEYSYNVRLFDSNDGAVSYDGLTSYSCSGGVFVGVVASRANRYYTDGYSADGKKQVMVHEVGHALGLGHSGSSACSGQPIMYLSSNRWTVCGHVNPQPDDVSGINYLY